VIAASALAMPSVPSIPTVGLCASATPDISFDQLIAGPAPAMPPTDTPVPVAADRALPAPPNGAPVADAPILAVLAEIAPILRSTPQSHASVPATISATLEETETPAAPITPAPLPLPAFLAAASPITPQRAVPEPTGSNVAAAVNDLGSRIIDAMPVLPASATRETVMIASPPHQPAFEALAFTRQLDLSRESLWLDRLAHDIVSAGRIDGRLRFELSPPALGPMEVEVRHLDRGLHVQLTTHSEAARAIIADAQPRLVDEMRAQGVRVAETQVSADPARQQPGSRPQITPALIEAAAETDPNPERRVRRDGRFA
jgi:flagellar hook-length control protein FliK